MSDVKSKKCTKCGEVKALTEFYKDITRNDGLCYRCKSCKKKYDNKYYQANREKKKKTIEENN